TRARKVADVPQSTAQGTPPVETPRTDPTPAETPAASEPTPSESPKPEPTPAAESPKIEELVEPRKRETSSAARNKPASAAKPKASLRNTPVRKKTAAGIAEQDADESEEVELTLTLPLPQRAVKLKEFLDTHPDSKSRPRATELLISTHAALGDQKLKNGDPVGGVEQLLRAIDEADVSISDKLFSGVIAQIPVNLYLR